MHTNVLELLHAKSVTQRSLYTESFSTQTRLHTETLKSLDTESFYTEKSLHKRAFTQRSFHTQKEVFTQRSLYTEKLLHTKAFTQRNLCTEAPLHEVTSWNWQQFFRKNPSQELSGTHLLPKTVYFQQICSKQPKEYISEAGPHSIAFKPTLRWNGGSRIPAEPTMSVSSKYTYHYIPYHTIPYRTVPYHTIPYHTYKHIYIYTCIYIIYVYLYLYIYTQIYKSIKKWYIIQIYYDSHSV